MFLTIHKIENIILDLDSFSERPYLLEQILSFCSDFSLAVVSNESNFDLGKRIPIDAPSCADEWIFYQSVILKAMKRINAHPRNTIFIAGGPSHLRHATEMGLGTVGIATNLKAEDRASIVRQLPDFILDKVESLPKLLKGELAGYGGELIACEVARCLKEIPKNASIYFPSVGNSEFPNFPVYISGRYFAKHDPRHKSHPLSELIFESKLNPGSTAHTIGSILAIGIESITRNEFDYVCAVPARPGRTNRLELFLNSENGNKPLRNLQESARIAPSLLQCRINYPNIKLLKAAQRRDALRNAFEVTQSVEGKSIVIVDDVQSSGGTMNSAIQTIIDAGAKNCIPLVVAYHPYAVNQWSPV